MGNREALIAGAKRCLAEKGYMRTTARDIASASGVSLAAIGYHFGSKEALLNLAFFESMQEWGEAIQQGLAAKLDPDASIYERFEMIWDRMIESFARDRQLWAMQLEMVSQAEHSQEMKKLLAVGRNEGRRGLVELFHGTDEIDQARSLGAFYQVIISGLLVQWLIDPANTPSGRELAEALRALSAR